MKYSVKYLLIFIMQLTFFSLPAQQALTKGDIIIKTAKSPHSGRVVLKEIENLRDDTVVIRIINEYESRDRREAVKTLKPKGKASWDVTFNVIKASLIRSDTSVEIFRCSDNNKKDNKKKSNIKKKEDGRTDVKSDNVAVADDKVKIPEIPQDTVIARFRTHLNSIEFLSDTMISSDSATISLHIANLDLSSIDKSAYIEECVENYITEYTDSLNKYTNDSSRIVDGYLSRFDAVANKDLCKKSMLALYRDKIARKTSLIKSLEKIIDENGSSKIAGIDWKLIIVTGSMVLLCIILTIWYWRVNKKSSPKKVAEGTSTSAANDNAPSLVVVGPKSATTLKKQSLDDVYDNESFFKIDTSDFCEDSLVRAIYIKNSCIKEIYNMYAEDLRIPDNPNEDGCMVLGRWVYDEKSEKYDISFEYTVMPGDDAVFAEYELNFGGKIKLKMSEKLRKLRKETGLQYDLTCWVHSHPGLGVFFSNSDNNVHHQLKHPTYPGFLAALVIDILTPKQDLGIFTFKDTESVNSKGDLTKMYSLEELYNWALQSERRSFDSSNYFDALGETKLHQDSCYGIQLSNSAIIDMTFLTSKPNGFIGFAHGYMLKRGERSQCVVSVVNGNESSPNTDMLGCFVMASHCSIPSIRKAVSGYLHDIHFVLVYTASNGLLTAIPVIDRDLSPGDAYYGEHKLENLKIWTRRRR